MCQIAGDRLEKRLNKELDERNLEMQCQEMERKGKQRSRFKTEQLPGEQGEYFNKPAHVDYARHIRHLCPTL